MFLLQAPECMKTWGFPKADNEVLLPLPHCLIEEDLMGLL